MTKTLLVDCFMCDSTSVVNVWQEDYTAWRDGKHAQDAFPYLTAGERELLVSGICGPCFDNTFPEDED